MKISESGNLISTMGGNDHFFSISTQAIMHLFFIQNSKIINLPFRFYHKMHKKYTLKFKF